MFCFFFFRKRLFTIKAISNTINVAYCSITHFATSIQNYRRKGKNLFQISRRTIVWKQIHYKYRSDIDHSSVKPGHVSNASDVRLMRRVCTIEVDENSIIGEKIIIRTTWMPHKQQQKCRHHCRRRRRRYLIIFFSLGRCLFSQKLLLKTESNLDFSSVVSITCFSARHTRLQISLSVVFLKKTFKHHTLLVSLCCVLS